MDAGRRRHLRRSGRGGASTSTNSNPRARWMFVLALLSLVVVGVNVAFFHSVSLSSLTLSSTTTTTTSLRTSHHYSSEDAAAAASALLERQALFAQSLAHAAMSDSPSPRGIVLPLFDDIATLGVSLILELRDMGVELPIEVPHCGDLDASLYEQLVQNDRHVRVYDVCVLALTKVDFTTGEPLFCHDLADCHTKFRSFNIKVVALVLSRFQEVMLLDADTLFFQNPMALWATPKYISTGTLFFHDRISYERHYLAQRLSSDTHGVVAAIHSFLAGFDVTPFRNLQAIPREPSILARLSKFTFSFQPSAFLLKSHTWALRSGHQMDSSLVLWNKKRQPRATAILASFVARTPPPTPTITPPPTTTTQSSQQTIQPPSYGDKEYYFLACELAETAYEFSEHAVGAIGVDVQLDQGDDRSVLCGDALHYFPEQVTTRGLEPRPLYMNSDNILTWAAAESSRTAMYRTKARPAWYYPGSFTSRNLDQTCPFNVSLVPLMEVEAELLTRRLTLHKTAENWAEASGYVAPTLGGGGGAIGLLQRLWRALHR